MFDEIMQSLLNCVRVRNIATRWCSYGHLKKDLLFVSTAMVDNAAGSSHGDQGLPFLEDLLASSCELAADQFAPLRKVYS